MTLILAENYAQFLQYCRQNIINPGGRNIKFISDACILQAFEIDGENVKVIEFGTPKNRPDYFDILEMIKVRSRGK